MKDDRVLRMNRETEKLELKPRRCSFCAMDTTDPDIVFDENGECNHCNNWRDLAPQIMRPYEEFEIIAEKIRRSGSGYNCVLGVSGGLDSTYAAYVAHQAGLKALLVHLDNGFDTVEAQHNIEAIREATGWEMMTIYPDNESIQIQRAYLKAGVANIEAVTDHAISALIYYVALSEGIKYVLSGSNWATEGILPRAWGSDNRDLTNIEAIFERNTSIFSSARIDRFIRMGLWRRLFVERFKLKTVKPLNYVNYSPSRAFKTLETEWGIIPYGEKHGENQLTRFYQKFILPIRWNVDKRKAHLSTLICRGEITRGEALEILSWRPEHYAQMSEDMDLFLEKFNASDAMLSDWLLAPKHYADEYPNNRAALDKLRQLRAVLRGG